MWPSLLITLYIFELDISEIVFHENISRLMGKDEDEWRCEEYQFDREKRERDHGHGLSNGAVFSTQLCLTCHQCIDPAHSSPLSLQLDPAHGHVTSQVSHVDTSCIRLHGCAVDKEEYIRGIRTELKRTWDFMLHSVSRIWKHILCYLCMSQLT